MASQRQPFSIRAGHRHEYRDRNTENLRKPRRQIWGFPKSRKYPLQLATKPNQFYFFSAASPIQLPRVKIKKKKKQEHVRVPVETVASQCRLLPEFAHTELFTFFFSYSSGNYSRFLFSPFPKKTEQWVVHEFHRRDRERGFNQRTGEETDEAV